MIDNCLNQTAYDTVLVTVPEYEPITLSTSPDIIVECPNISQYLNVVAQGGTGNYEYTWTNQGGEVISSLDSVFISPMATT